MLESLQGKRDLIQACVYDLMFLSRDDWDLAVAFHNPEIPVAPGEEH